jgi:hypothetical protein
MREEGVLRIFIALKNPSPWPGFEPATFEFSGQHTNHYTAKVSCILCIYYFKMQVKNKTFVKTTSRPTTMQII